MKNELKIIIIGCDFGVGVSTAVEMAIRSAEQIPILITVPEKIMDSKNNKGNLFDSVIELKHLDEPKPRYINKPMKNYRR